MQPPKPSWADEFAIHYNDPRYVTAADIAEVLGISTSRVRGRATDYRRVAEHRSDMEPLIDRSLGQSAPPQPAPVLEDLPDPEEPIEEVIERLIRYQERYAKHYQAKQLVDIQIPETGWFGVVGLGDGHFNNVGAQLKKALEDARLINSVPGVYAIGIGDWLDNFIIGKLERERRKDVISHTQAWRIQEYYFDLLRDRWITIIGGNHNAWIEQLGGIDILKRDLQRMGLHPIYDPDEVRVRLRCPTGQSFIHLSRHVFPGHSKYHSLHGVLVWALERWQGEDAYWGGHIHTSSYMPIERRWDGEKRIVHLTQLSSYKKIDSYAKVRGFRPNDPFSTPMILHHAATRKTLWVPEIEDGIKLLQMLRDEDV